MWSRLRQAVTWLAIVVLGLAAGCDRERPKTGKEVRDEGRARVARPRSESSPSAVRGDEEAEAGMAFDESRARAMERDQRREWGDREFSEEGRDGRADPDKGEDDDDQMGGRFTED